MGVKANKGGLYWKTGLDVGGLQADAKKAKGIIGNLTSSITKRDLGAGAVLALGVAFKKVTDQAVEFSQQMETSLTEVATISDFVTNNMDATYDRISKMATDTAQEQLKLSAAMYDVVSAGYDEEQAFKVLEASARASTAGFVDVTDAVDGVTTVLNAWGKTADDAESVTDLFLATVKKGKTTFGEFAGSISVVAPLAASAGISFEEISAATASLTKQGVPTSVAMTQIRSAIIALIDNMGSGVFQTKTLQEAVQDFANSMDGDFNKMKKAAGRIEGVNGILALTGEKAAEASSDLQAMALSAGTVATAFEKARATSENQSLILAENIKSATKPIGDLFSKIGTDATRFINEAFESGALQTFADTLKVVIPILGAYTVGVKLARMSTLDYLISLEALKKGFMKLNKALLSNPYVIAAAAITAATIAIVKAVKDHREEVKAMTVDMTELNGVLAAQRVEMDFLFETAKTAAEGTTERRKAIEEINQRYGEYLPNLLDEKSSLEDIERAYKKVSVAMSEKAIQQFKAQEIQEATEYFVKEYKGAVGKFEKAIKKTGATDIEVNVATGVLQDFLTEYQAFKNEVEKFDPSTEDGMKKIVELNKEITDKRIEAAKKVGLSTREFTEYALKIGTAYDDQEEALNNINTQYGQLLTTMKGGLEVNPEEDLENFRQTLQEETEAFREFNQKKDDLTEEQKKNEYKLQTEYNGNYKKFLQDQLKEYAGVVEKEKEIREAALSAGIDLDTPDPPKPMTDEEIATYDEKFRKQIEAQSKAFEDFNNYKNVLTEKQLEKDYKLQQEYNGDYTKYLLDQLDLYEDDVVKRKAIIDAAIGEGVDFNRPEEEPIVELPPIRPEVIVDQTDYLAELERLRSKYLNAKSKVEEDAITIEMRYVAEKLDVTSIEFEAKTAAEKIIAINKKIEDLQQAGIEANSEAEKKSIEDQITYWRWRATEVADVLEEEKELQTSVHELTYSQIRKQIQLIKDKIATERMSTAETEKWEKRLKELNAEGMKALIYSGGQFLDITRKVNEAFKEITGQSNEAVDNIMDEVGALSTFVGGILTLDPGSIVDGALEHLTTMTRISDEKSKQNARDLVALDNWIQTVNVYQEQLDTLSDLINKAGSDFEQVRALAGYWKEIGDGIKVHVVGAIEQAAQAADVYRSAIERAVAAEIGGEVGDWEQYGMTLEEVIEMMKREGTMTTELENLIEGWEEAEQAASDYQDQLNEILTGTTASRLADEMFDMFRSGEVAVEDFAQFFEDTMNNAILEVFKRQYIEQQMLQWYDAFSEAAADGIISDEERVNLQQLGDQIAADAAAAWEQIQSILPGMDETQPEQETMTGEIQRSITEETATILAGSINGILNSSIQIRETMSEVLVYQKRIEKNTLRTANKLDDIYEFMQNSENTNATNAGLL